MSARCRYAVVIDAGSSGSRVQVYRWPSLGTSLDSLESFNGRGDNEDAFPRIESPSNWQRSVEPGISSFYDSPDKVGPLLKPLFDFAESLIPPDDIPDTQLLLLATAGMRLLSASQQNRILNSACAYVKAAYRFSFANCSNQAMVITGEQEALYGWVAANYLLNRFDVFPDSVASKDNTEDDYKKKETVGFMDMGGASTQIAYEPAIDADYRHMHNLTPVTLTTINGRQRTHHVFVSTWLGYGTTEARKRYVDALVVRAMGVDKTKLQKFHDKDTNELGYIIQDPCLPRGLTMKEDSRHTAPFSNVFLEGTGSYNDCVRDTLPILNKASACDNHSCIFGGRHIPPIDFSRHHFVGVSEYWYSSHDMLDLGGHYVPEIYRSRSQHLCASPWSEFERNFTSKMYPNKLIELNRAHMQCFKAAWISNIIHEGFGIASTALPDHFDVLLHQLCPSPPLELFPYPKKHTTGVDTSLSLSLQCYTPKHSGFRTLDTVNNVQVSWPLGAVLLHASSPIIANRTTATCKFLYEDQNIQPTPALIAVLAMLFLIFFALYTHHFYPHLANILQNTHTYLSQENQHQQQRRRRSASSDYLSAGTMTNEDTFHYSIIDDTVFHIYQQMVHCNYTYIRHTAILALMRLLDFRNVINRYTRISDLPKLAKSKKVESSIDEVFSRGKRIRSRSRHRRRRRRHQGE